MFAIDKTDLQRFAVSSIGALILSAACIVSAVGPAKAAQTGAKPISAEHQADGYRTCPSAIAMRV